MRLVEDGLHQFLQMLGHLVPAFLVGEEMPDPRARDAVGQEMPGRARPADGVILGDAGPGDAVQLAGLQGDLDILPWQVTGTTPNFARKRPAVGKVKTRLPFQVGKAVDRLFGGKVARVPRPGRDMLDACAAYCSFQISSRP